MRTIRDRLRQIRGKLRASPIALVAAILLAFIAWKASAQIGIIVYKAALIALSAYGGYWIDRLVAPYARPDAAGLSSIERAAATNRRAIIVGATILAGALAL